MKEEIKIKLTPKEMFNLEDAVSDSNYSAATMEPSRPATMMMPAWIVFEFESVKVTFFNDEPKDKK